jgi:coenzyme F420-0:L-glutamate ligase/coenzyme F420-1:gamma-L-glutamate ligase
MSNLTDALKRRRSVRKYLPKSLPLATVRGLLEVVKWAPSAHNAQPWRFIVLFTASRKNDLAVAMGEAWRTAMIKAGIPTDVREGLIQASIERFSEAPVLLVALLTLEEMIRYDDVSDQANERDLAVQSLGAALQTLLLAASSKGIGACWYCAPVFCKNAVRKVLSIPEDVEPQAIVTLGYPAEKPKKRDRKPLHEYSYKEDWGKSL